MALNIKNTQVEQLAEQTARLLKRILDEFGVQAIPFGEVHWREAVAAYRRYGKGRHKANLNFSDCMALRARRSASATL